MKRFDAGGNTGVIWIPDDVAKYANTGDPMSIAASAGNVSMFQPVDASGGVDKTTQYTQNVLGQPWGVSDSRGGYQGRLMDLLGRASGLGGVPIDNAFLTRAASLPASSLGQSYAERARDIMNATGLGGYAGQVLTPDVLNEAARWTEDYAAKDKASDASFWKDNLMGTALVGGAALGGMGLESLFGGAPAAGGAPAWATTPALEGAGGMDAIEALIAGTEQGLSGNSLMSFVEGLVPGGTQSALEFYLNNPSSIVNDIFGSGGSSGVSSAVKSLFGGSSGAGGASGGLDLLSLLKAIAPAAFGAYASDKQADALSRLAERYEGYGAPSRARYESSFAPGFSMESDPGYKDMLDQVTKATLHGLSVSGNPADSPNAWAKTLEDVSAKSAYPALQDYRRLNAGAGGLAELTSQGPKFEIAATGANRGVYDAIGAGMADVFNPPKTLAQTLAELRKYGVV